MGALRGLRLWATEATPEAVAEGLTEFRHGA